MVTITDKEVLSYCEELSDFKSRFSPKNVRKEASLRLARLFQDISNHICSCYQDEHSPAVQIRETLPMVTDTETAHTRSSSLPAAHKIPKVLTSNLNSFPQLGGNKHRLQNVQKLTSPPKQLKLACDEILDCKENLAHDADLARDIHEAQEKLAQEKMAAQEKMLEEKLAQKKILEEKLVQEKMALEEKLAQEKMAQEKMAQEKLAQEKILEEKLVQEKMALEEKLAQEKMAQEKMAQEKMLEEKLAQEKLLVHEKMALEEKLAQEKILEEKLAQEKMLEEKLAQEVQEKMALEEKLAQVLEEKMAQDKMAQEKILALEEKSALEDKLADEAKLARDVRNITYATPKRPPQASFTFNCSSEEEKSFYSNVKKILKIKMPSLGNNKKLFDFMSFAALDCIYCQCSRSTAECGHSAPDDTERWVKEWKDAQNQNQKQLPALQKTLPRNGNNNKDQHHAVLEYTDSLGLPAEQTKGGAQKLSTQVQDKNPEVQVDYFQVFVNHFDELVEVVTFPLSLAQSLRRANLVSQEQVDSILNSKEPQDLVNVTRLLKEVRNLLKVSRKHPEQLKTKILKLCEVLLDQDNPTLTVIATDILNKCGVSQET